MRNNKNSGNTTFGFSLLTFPLNILIWQLALRYLRGKRSANAVPVLSRISMVAIAVSSGAMIIIFSVFNGLESIVKDMYKAFYPEIRITVARGKFFPMDSAGIQAIKNIKGVENVTTVLEDNVFAINNNQESIISLKGIDNNYFKVNDVLDYLVQGDSTVTVGQPLTDTSKASPGTAIVGRHIMNELGTDVHTLSYITLCYTNPDVINPALNPTSAYQTLTLHPAGVFAIGDEFDSKYVLAPLPLVQRLFSAEKKFSSIEIKADAGAAPEIQKHLQSLLGNNFKVEKRYEQNKTMYMVMGSEKWAIYAILVLVLIIASFNMVGALSMLVLEKQKDIAILKAMGAFPETIRRIFLLEGVLWALTGGLTGLLLGTGIGLLQQRFGFIKLVGSSFAVEAYPVEFHFKDFVLVIITILVVGLLAAWYPSIRATKAVDPSLKSA